MFPYNYNTDSSLPLLIIEIMKYPLFYNGLRAHPWYFNGLSLYLSHLCDYVLWRELRNTGLTTTLDHGW